jgi:hypothetical protein
MPGRAVRILAAASVAIVLVTSDASAQKSPSARSKAHPNVNARAAVINDFKKRVDEYVAVHRKLENGLPKLPKQATPAEVDTHERALGKLMQQSRASAKPGDIFTPQMQQLVRTLLRPIFRGKDGEHIKNEINDKEYKGNVKLEVNGRYPDDVPLSTVPPQVLQALPKLPEEIEYRFIQNTLILLDPHAHTIADFMERSFT